MPVALPHAAAPLPEALPSSPVHGVWNRSRESLSSDRSPAANTSTDSGHDDVAAGLIAKTQELHDIARREHLSQRGQEDEFDHKSLLAPSEPQTTALLMVI